MNPSTKQRNADAHLSKGECVVNYHEVSILGHHMDIDKASGHVEYPGVCFGWDFPENATPTIFLED